MATAASIRAAILAVAAACMFALPQAVKERAFFDVYPADDDVGFSGSWSVYPYFASGVVVVSCIESGLFVLKPNRAPISRPPSTASPPAASPAATRPPARAAPST